MWKPPKGTPNANILRKNEFIDRIRRLRLNDD